MDGKVKISRQGREVGVERRGREPQLLCGSFGSQLGCGRTQNLD